MNYKDLGVALMIDASDLMVSSAALGSALTGIGASVGLAADASWDIIQTGIAFVYFKDPIYLAAGAELLLPPGLDILPSTTAIFLAREWGLI